MPEQLPARERFQQAYAEGPPWDLGRPQKPFVRVADQVRGSILDAGCGTGENALFFAARGHEVVGIDFLETPIARARDKARSRGIKVTFLVADALQLTEMDRSFDTVIDCGLFHVFRDEERPVYVDGLAHVLAGGGQLFLMCFSDNEPGTDGPRRVSQQEIRSAFSAGWHVESIAECRFEVNPQRRDLDFSPGGPKAWFCTIRRT